MASTSRTLAQVPGAGNCPCQGALQISVAVQARITVFVPLLQFKPPSIAPMLASSREVMPVQRRREASPRRGSAKSGHASPRTVYPYERGITDQSSVARKGFLERHAEAGSQVVLTGASRSSTHSRCHPAAQEPGLQAGRSRHRTPQPCRLLALPRAETPFSSEGCDATHRLASCTGPR